jgi:hypothetical protein
VKQAKQIRIDGDVAYVTLTRGKFAIIDASDVHLVGGLNWCFIQNGYAVRTERDHDGIKRMVYMHRVIAGTPSGMETDHINMNRLDNRSSNLRIATTSENGRNRCATSKNRSGFKGVSWDMRRCKWVAQIALNGKRSSLGYFDAAEDAATAYAIASANMHGEFSRVSNFEVST